jgi:glycosyltransferase involved in cell wall biosynthesis
MFDVVITTRKRPELLAAAIESCLAQGEALHKVIVVFDPDDEETAAFTSSINDPRVVFHRLKERGGICGSRRAGFAIADAEWTVHIDDDWELRPGALSQFAAMASQAPKDVVMLCARILWTDGFETPFTVPDKPINYIDQLKWRDRPDGISWDNLCCLHKTIRDSGVNWMPELAADCTEVKFFLDAARCGTAWFTRDLLGLEKPTPEGNTRGNWAHRLARRKSHAASYLRGLQALLDAHGPGLRSHARRVYAGRLQTGAMSALLLGQQMKSAKMAATAFMYAPSHQRLSMLLLAVAGRRCFEAAYRMRG